MTCFLCLHDHTYVGRRNRGDLKVAFEVVCVESKEMVYAVSLHCSNDPCVMNLSAGD